MPAAADRADACVKAADNAGAVFGHSALHAECEWFALCSHPVSRWVDHPVLGPLLVCACTDGGHPADTRNTATTGRVG